MLLMLTSFTGPPFDKAAAREDAGTSGGTTRGDSELHEAADGGALEAERQAGQPRDAPRTAPEARRGIRRAPQVCRDSPRAAPRAGAAAAAWRASAPQSACAQPSRSRAERPLQIECGSARAAAPRGARVSAALPPRVLRRDRCAQCLTLLTSGPFCFSFLRAPSPLSFFPHLPRVLYRLAISIVLSLSRSSNSFRFIARSFYTALGSFLYV